MMYDYNEEDILYISNSIYYKLFLRSRLMKITKIGDCFLSRKNGNHLLCVVSMLDDFCSIKILGLNETFAMPLYRLQKLVRLGNLYENETLKILFDK